MYMFQYVRLSESKIKGCL